MAQLLESKAPWSHVELQGGPARDRPLVPRPARPHGFAYSVAFPETGTHCRLTKVACKSSENCIPCGRFCNACSFDWCVTKWDSVECGGIVASCGRSDEKMLGGGVSSPVTI